MAPWVAIFDPQPYREPRSIAKKPPRGLRRLAAPGASQLPLPRRGRATRAAAVGAQGAAGSELERGKGRAGAVGFVVVVGKHFTCFC